MNLLPALRAKVGRAVAKLFGGRRGGMTLSGTGDRGWITLFRNFGMGEGFQTDVHIRRDDVLSFAVVFACITLIASDIAKLCLKLMQQTGSIWVETMSPAFSPVLRKPNRFQTRQQFIECWLLSKLSWGNTYVLKVRDQRQVVVELYVLDPQRVMPLIAPDGSVFYQLGSDDLSKLPVDVPAAPASEIIHDRWNCLFHPLVGMSPIYASGLAASQGLSIQRNSAKFFENMSRPSGVLTAPGEIKDATAARIKQHWEENYKHDNLGRVAVLGDDLKYQGLTVDAVDAQMVEQLDASAKQVCATFHVPLYMVGMADFPTGADRDAQQLQYYSQCLQPLIEAAEALVDEGLGLSALGYRSEFELDDLLRMDQKALAEVEGAKVKNGIAAPNEARQKFNLGPVAGGGVPYLQQQNFSLEALAKRDALADPFATAKPAAPAAPANPDDPNAAAAKAADEMRGQLFKFKTLLLGAANGV